MPGKHWVIAKNLNDEYKILPWWAEAYRPAHETWMSSYYCAGEQTNPAWVQIGIYESEGEAQDALAKILQA